MDDVAEHHHVSHKELDQLQASLVLDHHCKESQNHSSYQEYHMEIESPLILDSYVSTSPDRVPLLDKVLIASIELLALFYGSFVIPLDKDGN